MQHCELFRELKKGRDYEKPCLKKNKEAAESSEKKNQESQDGQRGKIIIAVSSFAHGVPRGLLLS